MQQPSCVRVASLKAHLSVQRRKVDTSAGAAKRNRQNSTRDLSNPPPCPCLVQSFVLNIQIARAHPLVDTRLVASLPTAVSSIINALSNSMHSPGACSTWLSHTAHNSLIFSHRNKLTDLTTALCMHMIAPPGREPTPARIQSSARHLVSNGTTLIYRSRHAVSHPHRSYSPVQATQRRARRLLLCAMTWLAIAPWRRRHCI